ncbi:MAG TPA: hypothetical protein VMM18_08650 [Gemmatimonadaceae bacterium]|nr:hypothetical protein [Gemmatimonadaceae bacterium]
MMALGRPTASASAEVTDAVRVRRAMPRAVRLGAGLAAGTALLALWLIAGGYFAAGVRDLVPFTAPGAMMGITIAWSAFVLRRSEFRWRTAAWGAALGAAGLPPWLAFYVAVAGLTDGRAVVPFFIAGAWLALVTGLVVGVALRLVRR